MAGSSMQFGSGRLCGRQNSQLLSLSIGAVLALAGLQSYGFAGLPASRGEAPPVAGLAGVAPQRAWQGGAASAAPTDTRGTWASAGAVAAVLAIGVAASKRSTKPAQRARVISRSQGGVEGVRIIRPGGSDSAALNQELSECRNNVVVDGVLKMTFLVPPKNTGSKEEFELGRGTTDNVYILYELGGTPESGPLTLVDVPEQRFQQAFLEQMQPYLSRLEGLVITHVSEEMIDVIMKVGTEAAKAQDKKLKMYISEAGVNIIVNAVGEKAFEYIMVEEIITDDSFIPCRGTGRLDAVATSTLKYPELMNVFDEATGTLFSGKFFSAHTCYDPAAQAPGNANLLEKAKNLFGRGSQTVDEYDPAWVDLAEDWHHFFDCNFFTKTAQEGVRRIFQITSDNADDGVGLMNADVEMLAPVHGPVVKSQTWKLMAKYEAWLEKKMSAVNEGNAVVLYATAYSNTFKMAEAVAEGLETSGITAQLMNVEFCEAADIRKAVESCDGFAVGSPTLGGQMPIQMKESLGIILKSAQGGSKAGGSMRSSGVGAKPCGAFGSFGWSGEAPDEVAQRLKDGGFNLAFDTIRCKFTPTTEMLKLCESAGTKLAQSITKAKKDARDAVLAAEQSRGQRLLAKKKGEEASDAAMLKAFGQIINSSCLLTFKPTEEGGEGLRVPVSWVSQASFAPPGLMVAVEKKGLDAWLTTSPEEQLNDLFKKYDKDGSGELDYDEIDPMLTEMFGAEAGSLQEELLDSKKADALKILDADGGGSVDREEFMAAATSGPFAEMIARERKMASLESMLGEGDEGFGFTLNMLPEGMSDADAMTAKEHKKKKAKNGCAVLADCTSFVECQVKSATSTGGSTILYVEVQAGDLVVEDKRTELLRADHVAIDHEAQDTAAAEQDSELEPVAA